MRCIAISSPGSPGVLRLEDRPLPEVGPSDVLVHVEAAGVNRPDIMQRLGRYPPPPGASDMPGLEVAGTIERVGRRSALAGRAIASARWWRAAGTRSTAPSRASVPADPDRARPHPRGRDPRDILHGVDESLSTRGLREGERVLIHGGTSGIGTTAIQLARAFGATALATAGSDEKCAACERLGARAINYRTTDFVAGRPRS